MAELKLYVFDDAVARGWEPFALTRPIGELLLGALTFRGRAERVFGVRCSGLITADHLRGFEEPDAAPVIGLGDIAADAARVFISSRAILDNHELSSLSAAHAKQADVAAGAGMAATATTPTGADATSTGAASTGADTTSTGAASTVLLRSGGQVIGCMLPPGAANPDAGWIDAPVAEGPWHDSPNGCRIVDAGAHMLEHVWELIAMNPSQIARDHEAHGSGRRQAPPADCDVIGYTDGMFRLGADVTIEPNVVLDFSHGPIHLDDGVTVRAFTRLAGPAYIGRGSTLLGGPYEAVSIGPVCRVHGEVEESVVLGYTNKAHDGFLGHAYLGRWVNLGALSTNSDLKNNYGRIRMWTPKGERDTGLIKLGCLLGDHVRTGIGALINTGTVISAGCNLYGTEMPPKYVPPFSWGSGSNLVAYDADRFLAVAETVMGRRELSLSDDMRTVLRAAWQIGRSWA